MALTEKDLSDIRMARPVAVLDVWDIDDRVKRLEAVVEDLKKIVEALVLLYKEERVKTWEMILHEIGKKYRSKNKGGRNNENLSR